MTEPNWIDVEDAAAGWGVTVATVYRWIKERKVDAKTSYHFRKGKYLVDANTLPKPKAS